MLKCTHSIMSFYVLFFCQYWACSYYMVYCLIELLAQSAFAICLCVQHLCCLIFCLYHLILCCYYFTLSFCFKSPFESQRNMSSSLVSCLYFYCTAHALLCFSICSLKPLPNMPLCVVFLPVLHHSSHLVNLILLRSLLLS
jgi:hypothetical protein